MSRENNGLVYGVLAPPEKEERNNGRCTLATKVINDRLRYEIREAYNDLFDYSQRSVDIASRRVME